MISQGQAAIAVDLGASSGRVILGHRPLSGPIELVTVHRFPTPLIEDGSSLRWDVQRLETEIRFGIEAARAEAWERRWSPSSLSIDAWGVDYVHVDAEGQPASNPYAYRDHRVDDIPAWVDATYGLDRLYEATGIQIMPFNTVFQAIADEQQEAPVLKRSVMKLFMADYLLFRLGGEPVAEYSIASTSAMVDPTTGQWHHALMRDLGIRSDGWPTIVPSGTIIGVYDKDPSLQLVATCSHDTGAAVAAVPAADPAPDWAYLSSGTWSLLGRECASPIITDQARLENYTNEGGFGGTVRFLKNIAGLWVLQECQRVWTEAGERADIEYLIEAAAHASDTCELPLDDPRFVARGDMPTLIHTIATARGDIAPVGKGQITRAILHSLATAYADRLATLDKLTGSTTKTLYIVGGGSQNDLLNQWTANACGVPVQAGPTEATALGNLAIQWEVTAPSDMKLGQPRAWLLDRISTRTFTPQ